MPLFDVVVDTNVLMHASNPSEQHFTEAIAFVRTLLQANTSLCVDEGFSIDEAENRSLIGGEYLRKLSQGAIGHTAIAHLAQVGRLVLVSTDVGKAASKSVNQIIRNKRDRTFLRVAKNSTEQTLVSHDFQDFPKAKRTTIKRTLSVTVSTAGEVVNHLT